MYLTAQVCTSAKIKRNLVLEKNSSCKKSISLPATCLAIEISLSFSCDSHVYLFQLSTLSEHNRTLCNQKIRNLKYHVLVDGVIKLDPVRTKQPGIHPKSKFFWASKVI
jgi:hypothetical protein